MRITWRQVVCVTAAVACFACLSVSARAGLLVTEAQSIASWSGTPTIIAGPLTNASGETTSAKFLRAETFTATLNGVLDKLDVVYTTRVFGVDGYLDVVTVRLVELTAAQAASSSYPNTVPVLLTKTFNITAASDTGGANTSAGGTPKVLTLDFTGADEATMTTGKIYAIEFFGGDGSFTVYRGSSGANDYAGGKYYFSQDNSVTSAFGDRLAYSDTFNPVRGGTELATAFYIRAVPEPAAFCLMVIGAGVMVKRRSQAA